MSDLLIKGIGMPKPGKPIMLYPTSEGKVFVGVIGELTFTENEAFELPPHGRLGDLDAILSDINFAKQHPDFNGWDNYAYGFARAFIDTAPTIIPVSE